MSEEHDGLSGFRGVARLFPLPNLVLFPHVIQPLHIFEPRYRQLMTDALADDRLITMALLRPGWEEDYHKRPPLYPVVCIGRIHQEQRLADGRWNLLLHGVARARILEELPPDKLYREAPLELLHDAVVAEPEELEALREELCQHLPRWFQAQGTVPPQLEQLLSSDLPLGALCDIFSFALPFELEVKQQLLGELNPACRARVLLSFLADQPAPAASPATGRRFPPDFSAN
jgi:Lon protease-like protein